MTYQEYVLRVLLVSVGIVLFYHSLLIGGMEQKSALLSVAIYAIILAFVFTGAFALAGALTDAIAEGVFKIRYALLALLLEVAVLVPVFLGMDAIVSLSALGTLMYLGMLPEKVVAKVDAEEAVQKTIRTT